MGKNVVSKHSNGTLSGDGWLHGLTMRKIQPRVKESNENEHRLNDMMMDTEQRKDVAIGEGSLDGHGWRG